MSQRHRSKRPACSHEDCGSRRLHVGDDGFTYCDQGHQQSELGTVVAEDTGELVTLGKTSRKAKDSDAESQTSRVSGFRGPKAFEHYLLCLQLILRKQLRWLIEVRKLPEELEILIKDLWALCLQKFQGKISYDSETDTEAASSRMFSSQSEGESGTDADTANSRRDRIANRKKPKGPSLLEISCLLCVGAILLKIPLTVADLYQWIQNGDLLYYRAAKEIPLTMRDRLPGHLQEQLEPQTLVSPDVFHRNVLILLSTFSTDFGMAVSPINQPLVLYRFVTELCLPLEIYVAVQRLARLMDLEFAYAVDAKSWSNMSLRFPEIRLMALVVIATKLLFPFDDTRRYAASASDLGALQMDWQLWADLHRLDRDTEEGRGAADRLSFEDAFTMTEAESLELAGDRLDQYLRWYEANIASEEVRARGRAGREADFRRTLFKLFPTHSSSSDARAAQSGNGESGGISTDRLSQVQSALQPKRIVKESESDDVPRAGSSYAQHRDFEELRGPLRAFYGSAARVAGFSGRGLVRAVFLLERKLIRMGEEMQRT